MNVEDRVSQFIEEIQSEKIVQKNLCNRTWLSGSSTIVYPITVWKEEIVFQWESNKRIFDKFINRVVEKYSDLFEYGYFWKSDGSCPSTITFRLKKAL